MISTAPPVSAAPGLTTIGVTALVPIRLGRAAGMRQNSRLDPVIGGAAVVLWAIPAHAAGPLLLVLLLAVLPSGSVP